MLYWRCTMGYCRCTISCTIVHQVLDTTSALYDAVPHRPSGARRYMGRARCYMGDAPCRTPSCTGCTIFLSVVHNVVHHRASAVRYYMCGAQCLHRCAPAAQCYMGGARCHAPSCTPCRMDDGWCTTHPYSIMEHQYSIMHPVHNGARHCAPATQHRARSARWCTTWCTIHIASCTRCTLVHNITHHPYSIVPQTCSIVHLVHDVIWVVHNVMHHRAHGAQCYMGGARCRAPWCTGYTILQMWCTMIYAWCTTHHVMRGACDVVHHSAMGADCYISGAPCLHHCAPGAQCYMGGAPCRGPSFAGCTLLSVWCT